MQAWQLCDFQGTSFAKKSYIFVIFFWGEGLDPLPPLYMPMMSLDFGTYHIFEQRRLKQAFTSIDVD